VLFVDGDAADLPASFEGQFSTTLAAEAGVEVHAVKVSGIFPGSILVTASVLFTGTCCQALLLCAKQRRGISRGSQRCGRQNIDGIGQALRIRNPPHRALVTF
jgi:hypothetical protein